MIQQPKFKSSNNIKGNLFVKNIPDDFDNKALMDMFSTYGNILSCKVSFNKETGKPLHYGYVHFSDPAVAAKVLEDLNKDSVGEGEIYVMEYEKRATDASAEWVSCYVANFPKSWTKEDLQKLFEPYGQIVSVHVGTKVYKPEVVQGFVNFASHESAVKAVEGLKDHEIPVEGGEPLKLYVNRHQTREERERANQAYLQEQKKKEVERTKGRFLYVGFGSEAMDVEKLRSLFAPFGTIESCSIARDKQTGENKPFGFVCMGAVESAQAALKAFKENNENKLKVELAQTREERTKLLKEKRKNAGGMFMPYPGMYPYPGMNQPAMPMMQPNRAQPRKNRMMQPMMQPGMQPGMQPMMQPGMQPMMQPGMQPMMPGIRGNMQPMQPNMPYSFPIDKVSTIGNMMRQLPPITPETIANMSDEERRNTFGERLFTLISSIGEPRCSKITGMMLELNLNDLFIMVSNPEELVSKINEANEVLDQSQSA